MAVRNCTCSHRQQFQHTNCEKYCSSLHRWLRNALRALAFCAPSSCFGRCIAMVKATGWCFLSALLYSTHVSKNDRRFASSICNTCFDVSACHLYRLTLVALWRASRAFLFQSIRTGSLLVPEAGKANTVLSSYLHTISQSNHCNINLTILPLPESRKNAPLFHLPTFLSFYHSVIHRNISPSFHFSESQSHNFSFASL